MAKGFKRTSIKMSNFDRLIGEAMYLMNNEVDIKNKEHRKVFLEVKARQEEVLNGCRFGHQLVYISSRF